jgi:FkbM family methyltransferase
MYYGLNDLDRKLEFYLDFDNGFFFEAGANDGVSQSNTKYFEEFRGWRGILVEPIPQRYQECSVNRPHAWVEWAALVPDNWHEPEVELIYADLMTITVGGMGSPEKDLEHIRKGIQFLDGEQPYSFKAPARTISSILNQYHVDKIDFMSLDLEGFELAALRGLDMAHHAPTFLLIEARVQPAVSAFLGELYELVDQLSHHDYLYWCSAQAD